MKEAELEHEKAVREEEEEERLKQLELQKKAEEAAIEDARKTPQA